MSLPEDEIVIGTEIFWKRERRFLMPDMSWIVLSVGEKADGTPLMSLKAKNGPQRAMAAFNAKTMRIVERPLHPPVTNRQDDAVSALRQQVPPRKLRPPGA